MKIRIAVVTVLVLITLWWMWPQKVVLSQSEYDIAVALYRVCNQSSDEGLAKVEALLAEAENAGPNGDDSSLQPIIATAKAGQWKAAAKACRRVLDDQIVP